MTKNHQVAFPTTHWTLIENASNGETGRAALEEILRRYSEPLRAALMSVERPTPDGARVDDLLQGFIADRILENDLLASADKSRGKFRSFLLRSLLNYRLNIIRAERNAARRHNDLANAHRSEGNGALSREVADGFSVNWAQHVLSEALDQMQAQCQASAQGSVWQVFKARVLDPALHDQPATDHQDLVALLGLESTTQSMNLLVTAKRMFKRILHQICRQYVESDQDVDQEIRDLKKILAHAQD